MPTNAEMPASYTDAPLTPGQPVYTLDNRRLGRLKEANDRYIKVAALFRRDFWVDRSQIGFVDDHCVGLLFRSDEAELYKLNRPQRDEFARREPRPTFQ
jgi:hypothetical protein